MSAPRAHPPANRSTVPVDDTTTARRSDSESFGGAVKMVPVHAVQRRIRRMDDVVAIVDRRRNLDAGLSKSGRIRSDTVPTPAASPLTAHRIRRQTRHPLSHGGWREVTLDQA